MIQAGCMKPSKMKSVQFADRWTGEHAKAFRNA
jgi:hypothetical protein